MRYVPFSRLEDVYVGGYLNILQIFFTTGFAL